LLNWKINILLFFTCIIINPIRSGEKFAFSEEIREKHKGFRETGQGKFVLLKQKSGEYFSESPYKPCRIMFYPCTSAAREQLGRDVSFCNSCDHRDLWMVRQHDILLGALWIHFAPLAIFLYGRPWFLLIDQSEHLLAAHNEPKAWQENLLLPSHEEIEIIGQILRK